MPPTAAPEDGQLISDLAALSKASPKLVRSSVYQAPDDPEIKIRSWKMNEFKYYQVPSPFPTLARGVFSTEFEQGKHRIVARGYDKFFNIGEVPWTTWEALAAHTNTPYTLSLKLNGCIIFIAALTPSKLLITSKHSLGPIQGVTETHAQAGERWLIKHLESKGKTKEQLAAKLWEENWTAIAELCDDEFEEHVLPYPPEKSGLYLHGLNRSIKAFHTLLPPEVDAFADEWGFIKTRTITLDSLDAVKALTDKAGKTGTWEGEAVEGFVVRTHIAKGREDARDKSAPPYPAGSTFFFKVKFDEPYMMYRDWREVTKILLGTKGPLSHAKLPASKMKRSETRLYVEWVKKEIQRDREAFKDYSKGRGIILTRERFLAWLETVEGKQGVMKSAPKEEVSATGKEFGKTIILPVAVPGCGKTTVSVALAKLFGFGHTQSDDVKTKKKAAQVFIKNVKDLLSSHDVIIADKNNHLRIHRESLRDVGMAQEKPVRLLALDWSSSVASLPQITSHSICAHRILLRGDAHQTLRADTSEEKEHERVVHDFIRSMEELNDSEVDDRINMNLEDTHEQALNKAVDGVVAVLGLERPSEEKIQQALAAALAYAPTWKKPDEKIKTKTPEPRYFGLVPEVNVDQIVSEAIEKSANEDGHKLWAQLKEGRRITRSPHVTIVHKNSLPEAIELWERCMNLHKLSDPLFFKFKLGALVWNDRIMAITIEDVELNGESGPGQEGSEFMAKLPEEVRRRLHITVGTRDPTVLPVEAMKLVEKWRQEGESEGVHSLRFDGICGKGRVKGLIQ